ncbi:MAG TPA: ketol-acid reductoisomerase [Candidatus Enterenecus merdae]|nr:ketol-acid reductoisomerase [Candidatus Enterenecus merdae]
MAKMYYEKDCDLRYLDGKKIAVIGYGSQGHAHALNLKDSGCQVCVGLREGSGSWKRAQDAGLEVKTVAQAAQWADIVMMLINDEAQAEVYRQDIAPHMSEGKALAFAHGFNIRYQQIVPPAGVDVFMAAPKGPGHTVRSTYVAGKGVPCLVAVEQDATGRALQIALAYIAGIGGARAGVMETTFHDETETDLFGEQTVLCGGVVDLMRCGFEVLVEAGYEPENAYFECIHEMKLIIDLINKGGVAAMNYSISDTAEFGEYVSGPRVIPHEETKARMRAVLSDIQDGTFAGRWIAENRNGRTFFNSKRQQLKRHQMETVGGELRKNMIWGGDTDLDTASN